MFCYCFNIMKLAVFVAFLVLGHPFLSSCSRWVPMYKKDTPYCMKPLIRSEDFHYRNIKVSSEHRNYGNPHRVGWNGAPWCAHPGYHLGEWVQVDLGSMKLISGAVVEGWKWGHERAPENVEWTHRVTHYSVEFSPDGRLWTVIKDEHGLPRHFKAEREHASVRDNYYKARARYQSFDPFLHARLFRLKIRAWQSHQCLSLELYGCESHWALGNKQLIQPQRYASIADCHYVQPIDVKYWMVTLDSVSHTKNYGPQGSGSHIKWCVAKQKNYLVFDLVYRRFISRIEMDLFDGPKGAGRIHRRWFNVHYSLDRNKWVTFYADKEVLSTGMRYTSRPKAARYLRIPTEQFPYGVTCLQIKVFGCSDDVQSLGLWSDHGRVKLSWLQPPRDSTSRSKVRLVWPGQSVYCAPASSNLDSPFFRIDMKKLYAVSRIMFLGQTKGNYKCHASRSTRPLEIRHSIDGKLWSLYGTYNQLKDILYQGIRVDYEANRQCTGILDIMPTIFTRYLDIYEFSHGSRNCLALDIFGNQPGKPEPYRGKRKPGCSAPLGMESRKLIKDSQIKASTFRTSGLNMKGRHARLNNHGGWCVKHVENLDRRGKKYHIPNEFLEIDLLTEKFVDGFATQGHSSHSSLRWVTGYVLHYSLDGFSWDVISTEERERYFTANRNNRDTVRHYLNPRIRARYIRFVPVTWHKWICMRVEIYGCDAGESLQDKLEKKLLEIDKELVELARIQPGLMEARKGRRHVNLYYKKSVSQCGVPYWTDDPFGNYRYLQGLVDFDKTAWVQRSFNREFNASGYWKLFLHELRTLKTKSAKHFTCHAIMRDGTELYRHHVIAAKIGTAPPRKMDPHVSTHAVHMWDSLFEVPQIIVQQRVDPSVDGGMPIWETPAVVYASGSVASIGIIVTGIPYFTIANPRSYIGDRGWSLSYLGRIPDYQRNDLKVKSCGRLAQQQGFDHFVLWKEQCYSSHAIPANVFKEDDLSKEPDQSHREFNHPYFIKGMRKFNTYEIAWYKLKRHTQNSWIELFRYKVNDPDRETSLIFTLATEGDNDQVNYFRSRGRYRAYEKAYFADFFSASHVLEIERMTTEDLGTYKVTVKDTKTGAWSEKIIELRHEEEPRISLPETFGACVKTPTEMNLTLHDEHFRDPNVWNTHWYHVKEQNWKRRTLISEGSTILRVQQPTRQQTGDRFEVDVKNQFGLARGVSQILVTEDVPRITWVTQSPHFAAKDVSDLLEVKTENDKTLVRVDWYHNGTLIERNTDGFAFPGERYGASSFRKTLKLARISFDTAGIYRIVAVGKYCQFEERVDVTVVISPRLVVEPHAVFMKLYEGFEEVNINVTIKGGIPKPELQNMEWRKGKELLSPSRYGRVLLHTTLNKDEDWFSYLILKNLKAADSGDYTFTVKTGPASIAVSRSLVVLPRHEYFTSNAQSNSSLNDTTVFSILKVTTPPKSRGSVSYSRVIVFLHIQSVILVILLVSY